MEIQQGRHKYITEVTLCIGYIDQNLALFYPTHFEDVQCWKYQSGVNYIYKG